jgi:4-hydroxy-tetrahydrodipicolinate reductase
MDIVICGDGRLGRAIANAATERGHEVRVLGRPSPKHHPVAAFKGAQVVIDASRAEAVASNLAIAIDAGVRRFVVATTGWDADRPEVGRHLAHAGAAAVIAPNLSLGAAVFMNLVSAAAAAFAAMPGFDPFLWEWHRREKADRPSGTARELARRISAANPDADDLEIAVVRAGASPGTHVVGFDAAGETIELRLTARDRSAYAAGALTAADWLLTEDRTPGFHAFDHVVAALIAQQTHQTQPAAARPAA